MDPASATLSAPLFWGSRVELREPLHPVVSRAHVAHCGHSSDPAGGHLVDTNVRTPQDVFMQPQHLVVPPFQRPYVWEKEEQWGPLWQDVRRLAEFRLGQPSADAR